MWGSSACICRREGGNVVGPNALVALGPVLAACNVAICRGSVEP